MVLNHLKKNIAGSFAISVICLFFVLGKSGEILPGNFLFLTPDIAGLYSEHNVIGINSPDFRIRKYLPVPGTIDLFNGPVAFPYHQICHINGICSFLHDNISGASLKQMCFQNPAGFSLSDGNSFGNSLQYHRQL